MTILITGGTGFIGSHTAISLIEAGYDVVILDNLCNSSINILPRLKKSLVRIFLFIKEISEIVLCCKRFLPNIKSKP